MPVSLLVRSPRRLLQQPRLTIRAQRLGRPVSGALPPVAIVSGLNEPESRVYWALTELQIRFTPQTNLLGGSVLGGARADFLLPDYRVDMEYAGPHHETTEGAARDVLRGIGVTLSGYRLVTIRESDLERLKPRILELLGRPL